MMLYEAEIPTDVELLMYLCCILQFFPLAYRNILQQGKTVCKYLDGTVVL